MHAVVRIADRGRWPALIEATDVIEDMLNKVDVREWWELGVLILDHHGPLEDLPSATKQAHEIAKTFPDPPLVHTVLIEPPVDPDQVTAAVLLKRGPVLPEKEVNVLDKLDRYGKWAVMEDLKNTEYVPAIINHKGYGWASDRKQLEKKFLSAMEHVEKVIEDEEYRRKKCDEFWRRFRRNLENVDAEIIHEGEINGVKWCIAKTTKPDAFTYLYMQGYDLVVLYSPTKGRITIGTKRNDIDLKKVFQVLNKKHREGWGGRKNIGGSPKGLFIDEKEFEELAETIKEAITATLSE
ncbi:MAG: hypothetical protein GXO28_04770 [Methanopyri archaeon]|nr:hypothetical protein [Methanopyri archaeon]